MLSEHKLKQEVDKCAGRSSSAGGVSEATEPIEASHSPETQASDCPVNGTPLIFPARRLPGPE